MEYIKLEMIKVILIRIIIEIKVINIEFEVMKGYLSLDQISFRLKTAPEMPVVNNTKTSNQI